MSKNFVHSGRRIQFTAITAHTAGDLVYENGFYGVVQDDCVAGRLCTLILEGAWNLRRLVGGGTAIAAGTKVYAFPTVGATSILIAPVASAGASAGIGWNAIGRLIATSNASQAKIQLFNPNSSY